MAVNLPHDIVAEILTRLPVKDLLRYRSVAKPWCSLIDDPEFVNKQLGHAMKTNSGVGLVNVFYTSEGGVRWDWMDLDCPDNAEELDFAFKNGERTRVVGSCNGLLALVYPITDDVATWNPSTRKYRKLPDSAIDFPPRNVHIRVFYLYGFGYDPVGDGYKLLRLHLQQCGHEFGSAAEVYSAGADCWKRIHKLPYYVSSETGHGVLANSALHFLACAEPGSEYATLIIAFDLGKEEYVEVPMPDFEDQLFYRSLHVLGGSLCVVYDCGLTSAWGRVGRRDVWVMKDYGVKDSWTKLISVAPAALNRPPRDLSVFGNNQIIMKLNYKLATYDQEREWVADLYDPSTLVTASVVCVKSLVGLEERGVNGWKTSFES